MENNNEVLLKVDHLCQYFRMGHKDLKAVDDVSFEIKKGEAFGLVGESGCGKTTTGRSIIKLYDITSGTIYFKGQKISAGTRSYKDAISKARSEAKKKIKALRAEKKDNSEISAEIEKINNELRAVVADNRSKIRNAKVDCKEVDRQYSKSRVEALHAEYNEKLRTANGNHAAIKALDKEYKQKYRVAKRSKLITEIQMIFQDPIASLDPRMTVRDIIAEGLVINGMTDNDLINQKVYDILETVGLVREHADRYPHEFSGGQRQRIGIARAVVMQPEMIIADEPISALDVSIQAQVINLLNDLRQSMGLTIMFIAHDLSVV
ncbi:MAG: dipeptide/oligopeptide/nickel ABC transporter ATP-binding protein, partial [Ruminococcus sp.]|nr:dipeptide/oligopeptide/nickel ABC transporter ATP-binding protein [Ruminococcus sp.]